MNTLQAYRTPFDAEPVQCEFLHGCTIAQMLGPTVTQACSVRIGAHEVPRKLWAKVKPKPGQRVEIVIYPQGGDSGKWIRLVAMVVIAYFTAGIGAGAEWSFTAGMSTAAAGAYAAAFSVVAMAALNALVPPPKPESLRSGGGGDPLERLASLTGTSNQMNPHGVIPCVIGADRIFPPHAALPFTEIVGQDQYLRMMLDCGHGNLTISDIKIGETSIAAYEEVEWEFTKSPTLFTQDIFEEQVGVPLDSTGDSAIRTTQTLTTEISVDLVYPRGLFGVNKLGDTTFAYAYMDVSYRAVGAQTWQPIGSASGLSMSGGLHLDAQGSSETVMVASNARRTLRTGARWKVPQGQYEVRVAYNRVEYADATEQGKIGDGQWSVLRSVSPQDPSTTGTNKLCLRIRATDQLHGVVQNLSCNVQQRVRRWDSVNGKWMTPASTTNPAWIYLWMLTQCEAVSKRLDDDRVDYASTIAHWAGHCDGHELSVGFTADSARPLGDLLDDLLSAGMATRAMVNGKYGVRVDEPQGAHVQMFTPANSWDFRYQRQFTSPPHALRCKFTNPQASYQEDTRVVYWDGYSENNATKFEDMDLRHVQDADAVWHVARYHLANMWLRPVTYSWKADVEHLKCRRGQLVKVAYDLLELGVSYGRLSAVNGTQLTLGEEVELEAGESYVIELRDPDNGTEQQPITTGAGTTRDITISAAFTDAQPGDLYVIGKANKVTTSVIVTRIERDTDLSATLIGKDTAPGVWTADAGAIPSWVSQISGKPWCERPDPPSVHIRTGNSAPDDAGVIHATAGVGGGGSGQGIYRFPEKHCPHVDALVLMHDGSVKRAGDIVVGDQVIAVDPDTLQRTIAVVEGSQFCEGLPCLELEAGPHRLVCTHNAPIPTRHGGCQDAQNVAGEEVATAEGWRTVGTLRSAGIQPVQHIDIGDRCFFAGGILHHNKRLTPRHGAPYLPGSIAFR